MEYRYHPTEEGKCANKAGNIVLTRNLYIDKCNILKFSWFGVMFNTTAVLFIGDSLWWASVLELRTADFLASGKNEVMIASLVSLRKANGMTCLKLSFVDFLWTISDAHHFKPLPNPYRIIIAYNYKFKSPLNVKTVFIST